MALNNVWNKGNSYNNSFLNFLHTFTFAFMYILIKPLINFTWEDIIASIKRIIMFLKCVQFWVYLKIYNNVNMSYWYYHY